MMNIDKLTGMTVITKDGRQLGTITGMDIDEREWKVSSLSVRLDRHVCEDFGIERRLFGSHTVHIEAKHVTAASDTVVLDATLAQIEKERERERPKPAQVSGQATSS